MFNTKALLAIIAIFTVTLAFSVDTTSFRSLEPIEVAGCCA
jgi:hypothetical protein